MDGRAIRASASTVLANALDVRPAELLK